MYLRNRDIQTNKKDPITDYALACAVSEVISDIVSIQRDRDLWRIYVDSVESQKLLLSDGFWLFLSLIQTFSAGRENPNEEVVRVPIRGIPLSVEDSYITKTLKKLGAELTSDIKYEKIRNSSTHKMTEILNGNRFVYMKKMKLFDQTQRMLGWWPCFQCEYETCCKVCKSRPYPKRSKMRKLRLCQKEHHCFQWKGWHPI